MRSVSATQKHGRSRATTGRRSAPPVSRVQSGKRGAANREPPQGPFRRLFVALFALVTPRRPMLVLSMALLGLVAVAALFMGGYVSGFFRGIDNGVNAVMADAGFSIAEVHLSGNSRTPSAEILDALGFEPGQSIFAADVHAARRRLLTLPWIAQAEVRRRYPDDITVSVIEKEPFALWQGPTGAYVIDRSGGVITDKRLSQFAKLPRFIGAGAAAKGAELFDAVASHHAVAARLQAMQRVSLRRWNLILDDGVIVELPERGWRKQLDDLEYLIVDKGILERDISEIDLRSNSTFFFLLRDGNQKQVQRGKAT